MRERGRENVEEEKERTWKRDEKDDRMKERGTVNKREKRKRKGKIEKGRKRKK